MNYPQQKNSAKTNKSSHEQSSHEQSNHEQSNQVLRVGKELHDATLPFAKEDPFKSWFYIISTLIILGVVLSLAVILPWWPAKLLASIIGGLIMVRGFVIYHDYLHGAILRKSKLAKALFYTYGALLLTPPNSWRKSHNYHHAHIGKISQSKYGSMPIMTTDDWSQMTFFERLKYRFVRHPLILACGYVTVFLFSLCIEPMIENLQKHWDSVVVVAFHITVVALILYFLGTSAAIHGYILPLWIAAAVGSYLFYVQHNCEGMQYKSDEEWDFYEAAIHSSSYLKLSSLMEWFTANIGYHHVHHLNSRIPFYRLPEAMAAIPELQNPLVTTLHPRDIIVSLRLKLWDVRGKQMVGFK